MLFPRGILTQPAEKHGVGLPFGMATSTRHVALALMAVSHIRQSSAPESKPGASTQRPSCIHLAHSRHASWHAGLTKDVDRRGVSDNATSTCSIWTDGDLICCAHCDFAGGSGCWHVSVASVASVASATSSTVHVAALHSGFAWHDSSHCDGSMLGITTVVSRCSACAIFASVWWYDIILYG